MAINEYETEEQQVEALKKWWKENGTSLIVGLFVGISALFGYRYYVEQNNNHAIHASDMYMFVMQSVLDKTIDDKTIDIQNQLINEYSDTPYAALSALVLAKMEYEKDNADGATAQLEVAIKHASDTVTKQIASLRLAAIYLEQKKYDEAMALLNMDHDVAFDAQFEELKGDLFSARGDVAEARTAYDKAINLQGVSASQWLKLKRQNLGQQNDLQAPAEKLGAIDVNSNSVNL